MHFCKSQDLNTANYLIRTVIHTQTEITAMPFNQKVKVWGFCISSRYTNYTQRNSLLSHQKNRMKPLHVVEKTQHDTEEHVDNAKNHRHFHLKWIEEGQFVVGNIPDLWKKKQRVSQTLSKRKTEKNGNVPFKLTSVCLSYRYLLRKTQQTTFLFW